MKFRKRASLRGRAIAFDSDVLIYAAAAANPLGERVRALLADDTLQGYRFGSMLLLPELLSKPIRVADVRELTLLGSYLRRLELVDLNREIVSLAADLGAAYRLKAAEASHLATAASIGAEMFITNNCKDFRAHEVLELDIVYPEML